MKKSISSKKVALLAVLTLVLIAALSFGIVNACSKPQEKPQESQETTKEFHWIYINCL